MPCYSQELERMCHITCRHSLPTFSSHSFECPSFRWTASDNLGEIQHAQIKRHYQTIVRHQILLPHLENGHFNFHKLRMDLSAFYPLHLAKETAIFPCSHGKVTCCKLGRENWLQFLDVSTSTHSPHLINWDMAINYMYLAFPWQA